MPGQITISVAQTPSPIPLDAETLRRRYREETAAFRYQHSWSDADGNLTIYFTPRVYIRNDIPQDSPLYAQAVNHEQRHDQDFRREVRNFETELRRRLRGITLDSHQAADIVSNGLDWLRYRYCEASRTYHRSLGRATVEVCQNISDWP